MTNEPINDEEVMALAKVHRHPGGKPNAEAIANAMGRSSSGVKRALKRLAPEFATPGDVFEVPDGHSVKGISALVNADGVTVQQWIKTKSEPDYDDFLEATRLAFENYAPAAPPTPLEDLPYQDCLTLYPLPDMHIGMFSWGKETDVDWDLNIAEKAIIETIEKVHLRTVPSEVGVVLVGGDAVHSDTRNNMTEKSSNILQVDGRYDKVVEVAERIIVRAVELALHKHRSVLVRVLKGNHDYHTSVGIAHFLRAWYRHEPRISVDISPSLFWFHQFFQNYISAHHGHETKAENMPMKMADARPQIWGATKHRYAHIFHWHKSEKKRDTIGGVIVEKHEAPIPKDDWSYGKSFMSGRSLCSIAYDPERGESARVTENL